MKVYLETLGCQMNRLDSELVTGSLQAAGHEIIADRKAADVVLYNTCSVRQHAENKVHSRVGSDCQRKAHHRPDLVIGVLGCMAQRLADELARKYPLLNIVCGPGQLARLPEMIAQAAAGQDTIAVDPDRKAPPERQERAGELIDRLDLSRDPDHAAPSAQAYVRVMHGCNNFCTYCIVPYTRGAERSRPPQDIVDECRRLVDAG
ncbi:MAG: radical SAM protein, partial [Planctomycetota bacterium]